ncbi:MAG: cytidine deaminase [Alistipes sp.]|nr:cytidine deaminase [Alistipes sp.]
MEKSLKTEYACYESLEAMNPDDRELVNAALEALKGSFAPYSHFKVGAAARLQGGEILHAANIESEVFPSGLCAERSLLYYLQSNRPGVPVEALAIVSSPSERECYPCGACRQVMVDVERRQGAPIRVIMYGNGTASVVYKASDLLPFTFIL